MVGSSLPRPIRDPTLGKTLVAIPAPPFIFTSATSKTPSFKPNPHFIYVERKDLQSGRAHTLHNDDKARKPSINRWVGKLKPGVSPPEHNPWEGPSLIASSNSSQSSIAKTLDDSILSSVGTTPNTTCEITTPGTKCEIPEDSCKIVNSDSAFDFPSFESGSSLLRGSLPSISSTTSSAANLEIPPFPLKSKKSLLGEMGFILNSTLKTRPQISGKSAHRDASVLDLDLTYNNNGKRQHWSLDIPPKDMTPQLVDIMVKLRDLGSFFDDGMKEMQSSLQLLDQKLTIPSLIVSNSSVAFPITLDSFSDVNCISTPLAVRRGKPVPPLLSLSSATAVGSDHSDYPDIPTAFRGSPDMDGYFTLSRTTDTTNRKSSLNSEEMISNLRLQMNCLKVKSPSSSSFSDKLGENFSSFVDAERWLLDELKDCSKDKEEEPDCHNKTFELSTPSLRLRNNGKNTLCTLNSHLEVPGTFLTKRRSEPTVRTVIYKQDDTGRNSTGSLKKVRFDISEPKLIPRDLLGKKKSFLSLSSQARKDAKAQPSCLSKQKRSKEELTRPTTEYGIVRRSSHSRRMSTGSAVDDRTPLYTGISKRPISMAVFPTAISDLRISSKNNGSLSSLQGSRLMGVLNKGRENLHKSRSVSELFAAFKSSDDNSSIKSSEKREEKTKSRGNPLQDLLNRFKT